VIPALSYPNFYYTGINDELLKRYDEINYFRKGQDFKLINNPNIIGKIVHIDLLKNEIELAILNSEENPNEWWNGLYVVVIRKQE
jgi:hypothetical protein